MHDLTVTFEGDPIDVVQAIDRSCSLSQARLNGEPLDVGNLPMHPTERAVALPREEETLATVQKGPGIEVDFASDRAGEVAVELGLTDEQLAGAEGTGKNGALTVKDIRAI